MRNSWTDYARFHLNRFEGHNDLVELYMLTLLWDLYITYVSTRLFFLLSLCLVLHVITMCFRHLTYTNGFFIRKPLKNWGVEKWNEMNRQSMPRKTVVRLGPCPGFLMSKHQCLGRSFWSSWCCCSGHSSSPRASSYIFMLLLHGTVHLQESHQLKASCVSFPHLRKSRELNTCFLHLTRRH